MAATSEQDTISIPAESANEAREDHIEAHFMEQVSESEAGQEGGEAATARRAGRGCPLRDRYRWH